MPTIRGLARLYELFKNAVNRNQEYLDPQNDPKSHPRDVVIFEYTLNFKKYKVRGDTRNTAMTEFCSLYEQKIASGKKVSDLFDPDILTADGKSLRLKGHTEADYLYFTSSP